jgi:hypothetical protein
VVTDIRPEIWDRLDELGNLAPGWCDGEGVPPGPGVIAHAARIAQSVTDWAGPLRAYPMPNGGVELEWDDDPLSHTIAISPSLRLDLTTTDRNGEQP